MGFLDHSTNNIIVDAVLTDHGRQILARNDGSFVIAKFAFGDDEVDYSIIQKFGVTVGKEKISKNTPVFEAQTNGDLALKYRLLDCSTPDLVVLPYLTMNLPVSTENNLTRGSVTSAVCTVSQVMGSTAYTVPTDLVDGSFDIEYDNRFLSVVRNDLSGTGTKSVSNNIARVTISAEGSDGTYGGGMVNLKVAIASFSDDYYNTYSTDRNSTNPVIKTMVMVTGRASGATWYQEFKIFKS